MNRILLFLALAVLAAGCDLTSSLGDPKDAGTMLDGGPAQGTNTMSGTWQLVGTYKLGATRIRSFHTAVATETDGGIIFDADGWCQLKATRTSTDVTLVPGQHCVVPAGVRLELATETEPGVFGAPFAARQPYCYGVALGSASASPVSATSLSFSGNGFVSAFSCQTATEPLTVQIDLNREPRAAVAEVDAGPPTQLMFDISTDAPCSRVQGVSITLGPATSPVLISRSCNGGSIGTYAVVPQNGSGGSAGTLGISSIGTATVDFKVIASVDPTVAVETDCTAANRFRGCVVAQLQTPFISGQVTTVPVRLIAACAGGACTDGGVPDAGP